MKRSNLTGFGLTWLNASIALLGVAGTTSR
jgi:hypothetical protein